MVSVGEESRVDLGHPAEQPLLIWSQRVPWPGDVQRRERLTLGSLAGLGRSDRIDRRPAGVSRDYAQFLLPGQGLLADRLVTHVELAAELVRPLLRHMMRGVRRTGRVVQEVRLVRRHRLWGLFEIKAPFPYGPR